MNIEYIRGFRTFRIFSTSSWIVKIIEKKAFLLTVRILSWRTGRLFYLIYQSFRLLTISISTAALTEDILKSLTVPAINELLTIISCKNRWKNLKTTIKPSKYITIFCMFQAILSFKKSLLFWNTSICFNYCKRLFFFKNGYFRSLSISKSKLFQKRAVR